MESDRRADYNIDDDNNNINMILETQSEDNAVANEQQFRAASRAEDSVVDPVKTFLQVDVDQKIWRELRVDGVGQTAQPAVRLAAVGRAGVPVGRRREMRVRRVVVTAAVHHGHLAVFILI